MKVVLFAVIGDRCGDRLETTYHHSVSTMNKEFQKGGDRLKEELIKPVWKKL